MNWMNLVGSIPYIIAGIQQIHKDAAGADKKTIALEALGLAAATSQVVLPARQAQQASAVSTAVGNIIDNLVSAFHATNVPGFGNSAQPDPSAH
jgi:hypothetical protein